MSGSHVCCGDGARRLKRVAVSPTFLVSLFQATENREFSVSANALPENTTFVRAYIEVQNGDEAQSILWIVIESEEFSLVPETQEIPVAEPFLFVRRAL